MAKIVVQKFGGTSVQSHASRNLALNHVQQALIDGYKVVMVVSAMGRKGSPYATDSLLDLVDGVDKTRLDQQELDRLISVGELISMSVMVNQARRRSMNVIGLSGAQAGVLTTDDYQNARIIKVDPSKISQALVDHDVVVVAGFQGACQDGHITTLGRGGSDTSATAIGAALHAKYVDIFTDVNGVMNADPKKDTSAKLIPFLTYQQMQKMADNGAKVVHPRAVSIAMKANIPFRVRSTYRVDDKECTIIGSKELFKQTAGRKSTVLASDLIKCIKYKRLSTDKYQDFEVSTITQDTREVVDNAIFIAIVGSNVDGHKFIPQAIASGAKMIIAQEHVDVDVPVVYVKDTHRAMAMLADKFYGSPSQHMQMIGVTGTNGKTTVTHLIEEIFHEMGQETGLIGTLYRRINDKTYPTTNTTPDILTNQRTLKLMHDAGVNTMSMEVSSIALVQGRVWGIDYDINVFTNFTEDHLAYHKTMSQYKLAKSLLFAQMGNTFQGKTAVMNVDDPVGREFIDYTTSNILTYGINNPADVYASNIKVSIHGTEFDLHVLDESAHIKTHLIGKFNVYNALAAVGAAYAAGADFKDIVESLDRVKGVKGRFQLVPSDTGISVIVDYAHTPDGLQKVLETLNDFAKQDTYCIVGCGGDRDAKKRPQMAKIAVENSTHAILTEDNPRTEDPKKIMDDMLKGIDPKQATVILNRREAIQYAVNHAKPGDAIIITGKGHEDYQIIGHTKHHFDDYEEAEKALKQIEDK